MDYPQDQHRDHDEAQNPDLCYYDGKEYSPGSLICMEGMQYQCSYGNWVKTGNECHTISENPENISN